MKKSLFILGSVSALIAPIAIISSCSTPNKMTDFKSQYDLFTPSLINYENVSKNLAFSIDNSLIGNIYSIPEKLDPGINYSFKFVPSEDGKTLILYVQLYNYEGQPVTYSETSNEKEIAVISGFKELTVAEQEDINFQYSNFEKLILTGDINILPSSIKNFSEIKGSDLYVEYPKYKYNYEFSPNNTTGKLSIKLQLTSLDGYPLNPSLTLSKNIKEVQFMDSKSYQIEIDNLYKDQNEIMSVNLKDAEYSTVNLFASSITSVDDLWKFYTHLKTLNPKINVPIFLTQIDTFKYYPDIKISSNDSSKNLTIIINFYDRNTGSLLVPSQNINKIKYISNFKEPTNELLKATMDAYKKYDNFQAQKLFELQLPSEVIPDPKILPTLSNISNIPIEYLAEFTITVDKYPTPVVPFTLGTTTETFSFRPTITHLKNDDSAGSISFLISLEVKIGTVWFPIKPPAKVNLNDGKPSFTESISNNVFYISGFLTSEQRAVNNLYLQLDNKIKLLTELIVGENKFINVDLVNSPLDFYNVNFEALWSSLYTPNEQPTHDPLGIPIDNNFRINYTFVKTNGIEGNYNDVSLSTIGTKIYRWVKVKAVVCSAYSGYEYEYLTNDPNPPTFEFNFAVSINK